MSGEEKKYEYEYALEHNKKEDPRLRGIVAIYYRKKKFPTIRVKFPIHFVETIEIWSLYVKILGFKTFNHWLLSHIEKTVKELMKKEDPAFLLAKQTYQDIKNKKFKD